MKITQEQINILNSFKCDRLSSNEQNKELIKAFKSEKGDLLVKYMQQNGWDEDVSGETAFYLIKNPDGIPCLFFSLKCGALFEPLNEEDIEKSIQRMHGKLEPYLYSDGSTFSPSNISMIVAQIIKENNITIDEINKILPLLINKKIKKHTLARVMTDKEKEGERPIVRVHKTMPGVELTHFCANDLAKESWEKLGFHQTMGVVMFWRFIAPIIEQLQKLVGCQYMFLFAADSTVDSTLINYYEISLKFTKAENIGTSKPLYDFGCVFMSQEAKDLKKNRIHFFDNFNIDSDIDDIV